MTLSGSGFIPDKSILWDGVVHDTFSDSGGFTKSFIIPTGASTGSHKIEVCSGVPCFTDEFEEKAAVFFTVTATPPTPPTSPSNNVDYSLMALEVTQGVRGNIPSRTNDGRLILPADDAGHVANRRTVVRAYPRVSVGAGGTIRPVTAYLEVRLPGGGVVPRIYPNTRFLRPVVGRTLDDMRRNEAMSFNFVLPTTLVREGTITLRAVINPSGAEFSPECIFCPVNNPIELRDVRFVRTQTEPIDFRIYVADFAYYVGDGAERRVVTFQPSPTELADSLNYMIKTWPMDPSLLQVSYRYTRISQQPGDDPPPVVPPIPGYPEWASVDHRQENQDIMGPEVTERNPYTYIWLAFDDDSHMGCDGAAGVGANAPPLFHAGTCGSTLAQEAAHTLNLNHASNAHGELAGGPVDPNYPGPHGEVEPQAFGFDVWDLRAYPPDSAGGHTHDFMSYGGAPTWVSVYTWEKIASSFTTGINAGNFAPAAGPHIRAASGAAAAEYLGISGTIHDETSVHLDPVFAVTTSTSGPVGDGDYQLILRDSAGTALIERAFKPRLTSQKGVQEFYELVPAIAGLARLEISRNGTVIGVRTASSRPPTVRLTSPTAGDRWGSVGETTVTWEGSDPDGDALTYRVQASADGQRWFTIHGATSQSQAVIYLADVPGSGQGWRVRVQANDGLNVASAEVGGLTIDPKPPVPTILTPLDRRFIGTGRSLDTLGQAYDIQDGAVLSSRLQWLLDGKAAGTGSALTTGGLTTGEHKLVLRATNSAGLTGTTEVTIIAGADKDGDRMPDAWETQVGLNPGDPEDAAGDLDGDRTPNWREYDLGSDPKNPADPPLRSSHDIGTQPAGHVLPATVGRKMPMGLLIAGGAVALLIIVAGAWLVSRRRAVQASHRQP